MCSRKEERHAAVALYQASLLWSGWMVRIFRYIHQPSVPEPRPTQRRLRRTVLLKSVGGADVQPTRRFWVAMLYIELYLFISFINCLRSSMGRTGDACPPAPAIGCRPGLVGGADNLLNLLPVSVKPWIKALVNRSDVVIVREADSQDTLQLNCWCLPSREETRST